VCNKNCIINHGEKGDCQTRKNIDGILYALNYGEVSSASSDPIEKKPLYHFQPGTETYSVGSIGCNFECPFCQNWNISFANLEKFPTKKITPDELIELTKNNLCNSISFTYNEPGIWLEYILDVMKISKKENLKIILVTNGYLSQESINLLIPHLDAVNIDLKGDLEFYKKLCNAKKEPVLKTIKKLNDVGVHVELTNLIVPKYNDSEEILTELIKSIYDINPEIPIHFTRFFPNYKLMNSPPTPMETLEYAKKLAQNIGLKYIYIGNVPFADNNTYCPECNELIINRSSFNTNEINLDEDNKCPKCGYEINIKL
jgi:pyruvate formate lyase activating enzyme